MKLTALSNAIRRSALTFVVSFENLARALIASTTVLVPVRAASIVGGKMPAGGTSQARASCSSAA